MGCFNKKGNLSNLPIVYGDKAVAIIGLKTVHGAHEMDTFSPGLSFTPLSLPIEGTYNDYGAIENIVMTPAVKYIEEWFGKPIKDLINLCERCTDDCLHQVEDDANEFVKKVGDTLHIGMNEKDRYYAPAIFIEHKEVFDTIIETMGDKWLEELEQDYDHCVEESDKLALLSAKLDEYTAKAHDQSLSETERNEAWDKVLEYKGEIIDMKGFRCAPHSINIMSFSWCKTPSVFNMGECTSMFMLAPFQGVGLKPEWKDDFVRIGAFIMGMMGLELTWGVSSYYGQDYSYKRHRKFVEACLHIVERGELELAEREDEEDD